VLDITGEYYDVILREGPPSNLSRIHNASPGWILQVDDGIVVCGLGYLLHWNPVHRKHRRIAVPQGLYEVEVLGGEIAPDRWGIEFVLTRTATPRYSADPNRGFGMHLDDL
jgi:hypothetical protein